MKDKKAKNGGFSKGEVRIEGYFGRRADFGAYMVQRVINDESREMKIAKWQQECVKC